jgi:molybdopterin synthase sulfur carrier subunit
MSVTIHVPGVLRQYCDNALSFSLTASTLRDALGQIERRYPALYRCICQETGAVRRHINLFVNDDEMRTLNGLDTPLASGDTVMILPAVSGG